MTLRRCQRCKIQRNSVAWNMCVMCVVVWVRECIWMMRVCPMLRIFGGIDTQ